MNNYYLYVYLDPRKPGIYKYQDLEFYFEPFYVGISKSKNRHLEHLDEVYRANSKTHKCNKIRTIKEQTGNNPDIIKLFVNLSKDEAIRLEIEYIKKIGRSDFELGPLTNHTNGGDGTSGYVQSKKQKDQHSQKLVEMWKNKDYKNKMSKISSKSQKEIWKNENYRNRVITGIKEFYKNNPKVKTEQIKKFKKNYWERPGVKEKQSERASNQWKDKNFREKMSNEKEYLAKMWIITYPDCHEEVIKNLAKFCREKRLDASAMWHVSVGNYKHHHNFKCRKV